MAQTKINPRAKNWPYLEEGKYGPGGDFNATCEVMDYKLPSEEAPAFDTEMKRGPYAYFEIHVDQPGKSRIRVRHWEPAGEDSGSRVEEWLTNLGVPIADDGAHDEEMVKGKKCIVQANEPSVSKDDKNKKFTRVGALLGAG